MLIPSGRHTPQDLELWAELESADRLHGRSRRVESLASRSIASIRDFASSTCYAGVSWGKDSVVLAHLCWLAARHVPLVHLRPTNHNPDCDRVRDAYFSRFPGQSYEEDSVDYGDLHARNLADHELDRLTDREWYRTIRESERRHGGRHILGIRAGESFARLIRTLRWGISTGRACAPLSWWTTADIHGYLAVHDLPVHPAYACLGGGRWPRERLRVAEIGDTHGKGSGRREWELEYYGDVIRRMESRSSRLHGTD